MVTKLQKIAFIFLFQFNCMVASDSLLSVAAAVGQGVAPFEGDLGFTLESVGAGQHESLGQDLFKEDVDVAHRKRRRNAISSSSAESPKKGRSGSFDDGSSEKEEEDVAAVALQEAIPQSPLPSQVVAAASSSVVTGTPGRGFFHSPYRGSSILTRLRRLAGDDDVSEANRVLLKDALDRYKDGSITTDALRELLEKIEATPARSKSVVAYAVAKAATHDIFEGEKPGDHHAFNGGMWTALTSPAGTRKSRAARCLAAAADELPEDSPRFASTRTAHATTPDIVRSSTGRVKRVSGGHNIAEYVEADLNSGFLTADGVFVTVVGTLNSDGSGGVKKTLATGFDADAVLTKMHSGKHVGTEGELHFYRTTDGSFIGCHASSPTHPQRDSLFPVAVIDMGAFEGDSCSIGSIARYDEESGEMVASQEISVARTELQDMIDGSVAVAASSKAGGCLIDITSSIGTVIKPHLLSNKLAKIYAWVPEVAEAAAASATP